MTMELEEYGRVLDFLPKGHSSERIPEPAAQLVGEKYFTLFEVTVKPGVELAFGSRVYLGRENRPEVDRIRSRIDHAALTGTARSELGTVLSRIVAAREAEFMHFFNKAGPMSVRLHQLELLHGIGKKHLAQILEARDAKPFESFADMRARVPLLPDPAALIVARVREEMDGQPNHYLFVRPPAKPEDQRRR